MQPAKYDQYNRMRYHPEFHARSGEPWTMREVNFLIENYDKLGQEATSLELERTINSISAKVTELRKSNRMPPRSCTLKHPRGKNINWNPKK